MKADDFNLGLTNLLIDLYSPNYERYFKELSFDENKIGRLNIDELEKLTKIAAVIEYVGNRQPNAKLYDWIYAEQLKLEEPYIPGVEKESFARIRRIISAPKEFALRNVFYNG
ncbi:MAG TPA: hypothetical protein GX497_17905 [Bacillus bacterium]|nr:hypothetical protein [Bacillus sp. (in: firmicutes)]